MAETIQAPPIPEPGLPEYNARRIGFTAGVVAAAVMLIAIAILRALVRIHLP